MVTVGGIGVGKKVSVGQSFVSGMSALQTNQKEKFVIVDDDGTKKDAERLSLFKLNDSGKIYIVYSIDDNEESDMVKLHVAIFKDVDGVYSLEDITDNDEWTKVKDAMRKIAKNGQQMLKQED